MPVTIEGPLLQGVSALAFATMLAMACVADLRTRRIPNALVLVTFALGMTQSINLIDGLDGLDGFFI